MRVKTDARRDSIMAVAAELFQESGYERASMAEIAARVGGSKATLYNYFSSKEELFAASMLAKMEEQAGSIIDMLDPSNEDVASVLLGFGATYLTLVTSPDTLALTRAAIAEGAHSKAGARFYEQGPRRAWGEVSNYVSELQRRGLLREADPNTIVAHFKAMLEADYLEPLLWGAETRQNSQSAARAAVDALLRAYGTDKLH